MAKDPEFKAPFVASGFGVWGAVQYRPRALPIPIRQPEFKGLTLSGKWRDCNAMLMAQERGSRAVEEAQLLEDGCSADIVEWFLAEYWNEHDISAVLAGTESVSARTLSVVRQNNGYFQVRLFSPAADQPPENTPEILLQLWEYVSIHRLRKPAAGTGCLTVQ